MKIAVASGKGGTGKTTVAVSFAQAMAGREPVTQLDCDVEEPNCHLFLELTEETCVPVDVLVPSVDKDCCTGCGACADVCQFNVIAALQSEAMVFPELCHACGGCVLACPTGAITEVTRTVGEVRQGKHDALAFAEGRINVGEAMSIPAIRAVKKLAPREELSILDCPPGTACPMVAAVRGADYAILVTEPTPFGLHDLRLAVETVKQLGVPMGVVVNRADGADDTVDRYCEGEGIPVLLKIPDSRQVAEGYSRGELLIAILPELRAAFLDLAAFIRKEVRG